MSGPDGGEAVRAIGALRAIALAACVGLLAGPSLADIKSFNAAVKAGNFKVAAAEAVATWPTLNKARKDLAIIAREFGFAAMMAQDFKAARMFAAEAMKETGAGADADDSRALSAVLLRAAEFRAAPDDYTRETLMAALRVRESAPGFDGITFVAVQALVDHDFGWLHWKEALESSTAAVKIASAGGPSYRLSLMRFEMVQAAALYAASGDKQHVDKLKALARRAKDEIDNAASDEAAARFVQVYREIGLWAEATDLEPSPKVAVAIITPPPPAPGPELRSIRLLKSGPKRDETCKRKLDPQYPPFPPQFRGSDKFAAMYSYAMDIDDSGRPSTIRVLAGVPNSATAKYVIDLLKEWSMERETWADRCSLAQKDYILTLKLLPPPR